MKYIRKNIDKIENIQENKKDKIIQMLMVLVFGIMLSLSITDAYPAVTRTIGNSSDVAQNTNAKIVNVQICCAGTFDPESLMINVGDTVIWKTDGNSCSGCTRTLISDDGLFENRKIEEYGTTSYTFNTAGRFTFRTPCLNCGGDGLPGYTQTIAVNEAPVMKILSWSNNLTSDDQMNLNVPTGTTLKFDITTNYDIDSILDFHIPYSSIIKTDSKNVNMEVQFPSIGTFDIKMGVENNQYGKDSKTWKVTVIPTYTPTETISPTNTPIITEAIPQTIATETISPTNTPIPTVKSPGFDFIGGIIGIMIVYIIPKKLLKK